MGNLEMGRSKCGEYRGKERKVRNVKNEDVRIDCVVDLYGVSSTYEPRVD